MGETVTDDDFLVILEGISSGSWRNLGKVVEAALASEPAVVWPSSLVVPAEGGADNEFVLTSPSYSRELLKLHKRLYDLGLVVGTFDWSAWLDASGLESPPTPDQIEAGSAPDAVRLITVILRSFHFDDGALGRHWEDGTLPATLRRLQRWREDQDEDNAAEAVQTTKQLQPMPPKRVARDLARLEGVATACAALIDSSLDVPAEVRRHGIRALVRYATPKRRLRPGDVCSAGVQALGVGGVAPEGDPIEFEHVVPIRVLMERILQGDDPSEVLELATVAFVLRSEHRLIGPLVSSTTKHGTLHQELLSEPLDQLRLLSLRRYTNVGIGLFTVDSDWQFEPYEPS